MLLRSHRSQLLKERSEQNSSNSDFVFGENMVERVLVGSAHAGRLFIKVSVLRSIIIFSEIDSFQVFFLLKMWVNVVPMSLEENISKNVLLEG